MSPGHALPASPAPLDSGWRLALGALACLAGIGLQLQQPRLWPLPGYALLVLAALALALLAAWLSRGARRATRLALACAAASLALAGFGSTGWCAAQRLAQALPPALEGQDV